MTEKELRKLSRYQLLDLLVTQTERADELQKKVEQLENELVRRNFNMSQLGSLAEASLQLSGVIEAAQEAADMYLDAARKQAELILSNARSQAASVIVKAEMQARSISSGHREDKRGTRGELDAE
ncbi:MAG: DivIVA domain-containing protein [Clostridia bacterium]|nr:DivIVA domain-containing protein [Clostridia bacterium]